VEAARILGCHVSLIGKLVARGALTSLRGRASLSRAEVEALAEFRRAAESQARGASELRATRPDGPEPSPPDTEHEWLRTREAAAFMGVSPPDITQRARCGRLPFVIHEGWRWFRRDHLELVKRTDLVKRRPLAE